MRDSMKTALNAWIQFRNENPDYYFPDKSDVNVAWEDLDEAMTTLDEEFSEELQGDAA